MVQTRHIEEQGTSFKMAIFFVCLLPVSLLLSIMVVLYHVKGKLQRAYYQQKY